MTKPTPLGFEPEGRKAGGGKRVERPSNADAWAQFDAEIEKAVESAEGGELQDPHEVFAEAKARLRAAIAKKRG